MSVTDSLPTVSQDLDAVICWMSERPLRVGDKYSVRHNSATVKAVVKSIVHRWDVHTYEQQPADELKLNDIALVRLRAARPLAYDAYQKIRPNGGIILVNENSFDTVAGGMLQEQPLTVERNQDFSI